MNDESEFSHVLYHNDHSHLEVGQRFGDFDVISRGLGKYLRCASTPNSEPYIHLFGSEHWYDYRLRAVVTPVSFEQCLAVGGFCGILARYKNSFDFLAFVLARDGHIKLLQRTTAGFQLLASAPLEFCIGQSLTLTLTVKGGEVIGTAGPYAGKTTIRAQVPGGLGSRGQTGFICTAEARFGPQTVESTPDEAKRVDDAIKSSLAAAEKKRAQFPKMKREIAVPLNGLATCGNLQLVDINRDGKLEILAAQSSKAVADRVSLTTITCLSALDLKGQVLWQAGVPSKDGEVYPAVKYGDLPFGAHDLFGDGHIVVVCVFGYDVQIRDGKTGSVIMSGQTPSTAPVSDEFKNMTLRGPWGDEALNMRVARIGFCDTQGNGAKKEILVTDGKYNLAVLDPLAEPVLHPIIQYRGNVLGKPWSGDFDGDDKDELIAGGSVLDDDGRKIATLPFQGTGGSVLVVDSVTENCTEKRIYVSSDDDGLIAIGASVLEDKKHKLSISTQRRKLVSGEMTAGKFRADLPGLQFAAKTHLPNSFQITLLDSELNTIWMREFSGFGASGCLTPINWNGKPEALLLFAVDEGHGLLDGYGDLVVEIPENGSGGYGYCSVIKGYCPDGRDAIAAWNSEELAIYVPNP